MRGPRLGRRVGSSRLSFEFRLQVGEGVLYLARVSEAFPGLIIVFVCISTRRNVEAVELVRVVHL